METIEERNGCFSIGRLTSAFAYWNVVVPGNYWHYIVYCILFDQLIFRISKLIINRKVQT